MHFRQLWIVLGMLAASAVSATVVYKWTDSDGVVHFSDTAVPGAEKIVTSSGSSNGIGGSTPGPNRSPQDKTAARPFDSITLSIESPTPEQVFFGDDAVSVRLRAEPALKPGQTVSWQLNGSPVQADADAVSFTLPHLDRGTYSIGATVTDGETGQTQSVPSVTFYVRQPSELGPQHKKP